MKEDDFGNYVGDYITVSETPGTFEKEDALRMLVQFIELGVPSRESDELWEYLGCTREEISKRLTSEAAVKDLDAFAALDDGKKDILLCSAMLIHEEIHSPRLDPPTPDMLLSVWAHALRVVEEILPQLEEFPLTLSQDSVK